MLTRARRTKAFTLVELLIVILLIAILMAIAIPNFLGSRQKAGDRTAQQTLRTAMSSVKAYASDADDFAGVTATTLKAAEPNIAWSDTAVEFNGNARPVYVVTKNGTATGDAGKDKVVILSAPGADGVCWSVEMHLDADPDRYAAEKDQANCGKNTLPATPAPKVGEFPARP